MSQHRHHPLAARRPILRAAHARAAAPTRGLLALLAAAAAAAVSGAAGCGEAEVTAIELEVAYERDMELDRFQVTAADRSRGTDARPSVRVLVPDDWADAALTVRVDGLRGDRTLATGAVEVVPVLGAEVTAQVTLARLPCGDGCEPGDAECQGDAVVACAPDDDGCPVWGEPSACPDEMPYCSLGACSDSCTDECDGPICDGLSHRDCGHFDSDPCLDLGPRVSCEPADPCTVGACTADGCVTTPLVCDMPPPPVCVDADTLRVHDAAGACTDGACSYPHTDTTCAGGCAGGACACTPRTCAEAGANCGVVPDGCGGTLQCGPCSAPHICGGGGELNRCAPCADAIWGPGQPALNCSPTSGWYCSNINACLGEQVNCDSRTRCPGDSTDWFCPCGYVVDCELEACVYGDGS
jgi:hypothetical protein